MPPRRGLGYRSVHDPRASAYLMTPYARQAPSPPREKIWSIGPVLDQGDEGSCVGHGWTAWRNAEPVVPSQYYDHAYAVKVYSYAQNNDEFADTPPEEGTSVQAGAKAMVSDGALKESYIWGRSYDEMISWIGNYGPCVIGTLWLEGMFEPDSTGYVAPRGRISGGHCYLAYGYRSNGDILFQNSWGESWGKGGTHYMTRSAFEALLIRGDFSICAAAEQARLSEGYYPTLDRVHYMRKKSFSAKECVLVDSRKQELGYFEPKATY